MARMFLTCAVVFALFTPVIAGEPPRAEFDVNYLVGCRNVTTPEFSELSPDEKLLEARFRFSFLLHAGEKKGRLTQLLYRIESPEQNLRIIDYLPKTTLSTNVVGKVGVQRSEDSNYSLGINVQGKYEALANGNVSGKAATSSGSKLQYELLPPLELLGAAGTTGRASGVYYKMRPSNRASLEGAREYTMVFRVPVEWRADYVVVRCEAVCESGDRKQADFIVALYEEGDLEARDVATRFVRGEVGLVGVASRASKAIDKLALPTPFHRMGASMSIVDRKIPRGWLSQVLMNPNSDASLWVNTRLPANVRAAVGQYREARAGLRALNAAGL